LASAGGDVRTDAVQVELRQRGGLEAVDLGLAMARAWWRPLATTWGAIVLPIGLGIVTLLRNEPLWAIVLLWWLRPAFGRIPLYVLSRKLFGEPVGLRGTVAALPQLARSGLLVSLTAQRLSPARTVLQPVLQLEGLRGAARRERSLILARQDTGASMGLLTVGAHMNGAFLFGLPLLMTILVPDEIDWSLGSLMDPFFDGTAETADRLVFSLLYLAGISLVEPLMVAGGFALYVNRRIFIEGWDIDLAFRHLAARRASSEGTRSGLAAAVLALVLATAGLAGDARAQRAPCDPDDLRSAGGCIEHILASGDFGGSEEKTRWMLKDFGEPTAASEAPGWLAELLARALEIGVWVGLGVAVLALAVTAARTAEPVTLETLPRAARPARLFGLDLDPVTLPEDLLGTARRAWSEGRSIEAMSLLYRGALIRLVDHHGVEIPESATEYECVALVDARDEPEPARVFVALTDAWVGVRYAALPPSDEVFDGLCRSFERAFGAPA
jgi:hypothetical protein